MSYFYRTFYITIETMVEVSAFPRAYGISGLKGLFK